MGNALPSVVSGELTKFLDSEKSTKNLCAEGKAALDQGTQDLTRLSDEMMERVRTELGFKQLIIGQMRALYPEVFTEQELRGFDYVYKTHRQEDD